MEGARHVTIPGGADRDDADRYSRPGDTRARPSRSRGSLPPMGGFLIGLGVVLIALAVLLAFTVYGEIAGLLGVVSSAAGAWLLARRSIDRANRT
jgi:hypothetical protein